MNVRAKRAKMMGEEKIPKVLLKLAFPAIIGMMINAIYNIVDTMFVGMLGNTSAIGAVSVAFPVFMIISSVGLGFGIGAASYISRLLGEKNKLQADKTTSTAFFTSLACGILFTIFGLSFTEPILKMFGATETIMPFAITYSKVIIGGSILTMLNMTMNNMIRAEGNARYSMIAISMGAIINIFLDPIFMFALNMGVKGAAIATVLSQFISFVFLLKYFALGKSYIRLSPKLFTFSKAIYLQIFKIGIPTFVRQALASISIGMINVAAMPYGDAAVASMGVSLRIFSLGSFIIFGYSQGFQPVAGYNYGAKKYDRLFESIKLSLKWTTIFTTLVAIGYIVFAETIISAFSTDPEVIRIGARTLRAIALLFPLFGFQNTYATLFQGLGKGIPAFILSLSRQGIFLIPAIVILPKIFELNGVIFSQTVADFFTIIVTVILAIKITRKIKTEEKTLKDFSLEKSAI